MGGPTKRATDGVPTIDLLDLRNYETEGQPHDLFRHRRALC